MSINEQKVEGERRLQVKYLASLRSWRRLRFQNLEDLQGFIVVLDCALIAIQDRKSLNFTAKEKRLERDIQAYKFWLVQNNEEDTFESLIGWLEIKIQLIDETQEETGIKLSTKKEPQQ